MTRAAGLAAVTGGVVTLLLAAGLFVADDRPDAPDAADTTIAQAVQEESWIDERSKGAEDAPIRIYEVGDFQCPACRIFFDETLPTLEREYIRTGKVRLTFINLPLASIHPNAPAAHEFAMCAARQDRFWPVHDLLYQHQETWARQNDPRPMLLGFADSVGLDVEALKTCLESGSAMAFLQAEANSAVRAGVRSTPSFVVDRTLLPGAVPMEAWRPILDSLLAEQTGF